MRLRLPHAHRWTLPITVAGAALLALGVVSAPASATPSPTPAPSGTHGSAPSGSPGATPPAGGHHPAKPSSPVTPAQCVTYPTGRLTNCPKRGTRRAGPLVKGGTVQTTPTDLAKLVDTRTWTTGGGNTFPGAEAPYGMVQWSPDTQNRSAGGGYSYGDTQFSGYSLTHISGPGCPAAGDVPILPMTGDLPGGNPNKITSSFSNSGEVAQAGYYSAETNQPATITSEFTATPHSSMGRFTFPATTQANFLIKLQDSQNGDFGDGATIVNDHEISGYDTSGHFCNEDDNGGQVQEYTVHFDLVFDHPFTAHRIVAESGQDDPAAVLLTFDATADRTVQAKVGISYVSAANARLNWQTENPGWDFDAVKAADQRAWNALLGKIQVSGGSYAKTQQFYSLLYKDFIQPNITSDVNGQYMGADMKVHTLAAGQHDQYGIYSGWDIYHTLAQLQAMLDPAAAGDQAQSQVNYYSQDKLLQQWGYLNLNNYVMVGDPSQAIIADYYAFGGHNFHTRQALSDMLAQADTVNDVRPGEALEQKYGYLPSDGTYVCPNGPGCGPHGQVSTLLEYDSADLALASFARSLGDHKDAAMLETRANNWENLFDGANGLLNPRLENGQFIPGITRTTEKSGEPYYVEGDAYEYLWDVPNNYAALFNLLGGQRKVAKMLREYLSKPDGGGEYAELANEFGLGEQYALDYAADPAGTQQAVNNIRNNLYKPGPGGLDNNDDLGAMSSAFVWEMLGMYPENPGTDTMVFNSPAFPHAVIHLANHHTITMNAPGASPTRYYVRSLRIDGRGYSKLWVPFSQLARGARLDWQLSTTPTRWGTSRNDAPPSYQRGTRPATGFLSDPQVTVAPGGSTTVELGAANATDLPEWILADPDAPKGISVTAGGYGRIHLGAHGSAKITLTVRAGASTPQTFYEVPIRLTRSGAPQGGGDLDPVTLTVLVAPPGSLLSTFDNRGVSADSAVGQGNFDGGGFSYSAQALDALGIDPAKPVTAGPITYTWPLPAAGDPDNVIAAGQRVTVDAPAGTRQVGFLGAADHGPGEGVATLHYADGSSSRYWLGFSDWTLNGSTSTPSYGNETAAKTSYRNCAGCTGGRDTVNTYLFSAVLPVDATKTLTGVTLPQGSTSGALHIFAIGTTTTAIAGPAIASLQPNPATAGQTETITGSGFGATRGNGYVAFSDQGISWGSPGNVATFHVDSWSDTQITFTVPTPSGGNGQWRVWPGTDAAVSVVDDAGDTSATSVLAIKPSSDPADYYDNAGISSDTDTGCANLDGDGFSLSEQALAKAGLGAGAKVTYGGVGFTWPSAAPCTPDNILAAGQTVLVDGTPGTSTVGFLGTSVNGGSAGTVTITYTDGSTTTAPLAFSDWAGSATPPEVVAATTPYRNSTSATSQAPPVSIFEVSVPVNSAKTIASVTLPDVGYDVDSGVTDMHIFAIGTGS